MHVCTCKPKYFNKNFHLENVQLILSRPLFIMSQKICTMKKIKKKRFKKLVNPSNGNLLEQQDKILQILFWFSTFPKMGYLFCQMDFLGKKKKTKKKNVSKRRSGCDKSCPLLTESRKAIMKVSEYFRWWQIGIYVDVLMERLLLKGCNW